MLEMWKANYLVIHIMSYFKTSDVLGPIQKSETQYLSPECPEVII